jgi:UDP-N-acetylmuramyl tripeptide synthase
MPTDGHRVGLFEVDEAAVPDVLSTLNPMAVLLLDLFRDQLDRYGEVAIVAALWTAAIARVPGTAQVIANADDPLVAEVARAALGPAVLFGIQESDRRGDTQSAKRSPDHARDVKACPRCGGHIEYRRTFMGHLGHYACSQCSFARPAPSIWAEMVCLHGVSGSDFRLVAPMGSVDVSLPLPGLYNVYNALGAAAVAITLGIELGRIASSLAAVTPAFGRMERFEAGGRDVFLALAKNPAGLNEVLRTILATEKPLHLMVMLNDNIADGRDVSWIWDADVELACNRVATIVFAGVRAEDMALRFKYAGIITPEGGPDWVITHNTADGFDRALAMTPKGGDLFVVPTYTALLDIYGVLARRGLVRPFWEE